MDSLRALPEGALYGSRNGRASVQVARVGDTVYVDAVCDSLMAQCEWYEEIIRSQARSIDEMSRKEQEERMSSNDTGRALKWALAGFLLGVGVMIAIGRVI